MNSFDVYICRGFNRSVVLPREMKREAGLRRVALVFAPDFNCHSAVEWHCVKDCFWEVVNEIKLSFSSSASAERDEDEADDVPLRVVFSVDGQLR